MHDHRPAALLAFSLLLAACASPAAEETPPPAPAAAPVAAAAPAPAVGLETGLRAPSFRLPSLSPGGDLSLEDALARQAGRPLVLVLGAADCVVSNQQMEEMAAEAVPGPGSEEPAFLAVVQGDAAAVRSITPKMAFYPVLVDAGGSTLDRFRVTVTPSIVVLDGTGRIVYIGEGGYIPVKELRAMAAAAARGEPIDASSIQPAAG